jgi:hypothetical protein
MHWRKLEVEILAPMVLQNNILENHKTKVAVVDLERAISMEGAEGSTYCQEMNFRRK